MKLVTYTITLSQSKYTFVIIKMVKRIEISKQNYYQGNFKRIEQGIPLE